MKKVLLIIIVVLLAVVLFACSKEPEVSAKGQTIIEYALGAIDETGNETLEFLYIESVPYLDWDCAYYILTVNGKSYYVDVYEKGDEIHYVDVIKEIGYGQTDETNN